MPVFFTKSTKCASARNCVEVAVGRDAVLVRDSKAPGAVLVFAPATWSSFITALKKQSLN